MTTKNLLLIVLFLLPGTFVFSQLNIDSLFSKIDPQKFAATVKKKSEKLEDKIISKSLRALSKIQRQEKKMYQRLLGTKDSLLAKTALAEIEDTYKNLNDKFSNPALSSAVTNYIPHLDTIRTALKFLDQQNIGKIKDAFDKVSSLNNRFQQAATLRQFIRERKEQLKTALDQLGIVKQLKHFNKEVYYYAEQIKEYKEMLSDQKKIEKKAIEFLSKTKLFQEFMRKNSMLASLFRMPVDNPNDPAYLASLAGLQTRAQVNNLMQQQINAGGSNAQQVFQQNMQYAQSQLNQLKNKFHQFASGNSEDYLPEGFQPNHQKIKSFFKRLEYGTNVQSQRATSFFPVTSDVGLFLGYQLNDKSIVGVGASYKIGWGRGWNNIRISNEGVGLRSFIDWKIKGSFWLSGGYEQNHKTAFRDFTQLSVMNGWQSSGLIGLSKVVDVKSRFFKKTKLQLLWDFLSYQQIPKTQPVLIRIAYNFK